MRHTLILLVLIIGSTVCAQTIIDKNIPVKTGQTVKIEFDYPELVKVSTWDKNEISVRASVSINQGENDDAFELRVDNSGNVIHIDNKIMNFKNLPRRVTVRRNGERIVFKSESEWEKYREEHGLGYHSVSHGVDMDIVIEIKVPRQTETAVQLVYGTLEVSNFNGPLVAKSTYGAVDASLTERGLGEISAETNYGKIYTNLTIEFDESKSRNEAFHTYIIAKPGSGPKYAFESKYGNVYLRKVN